MHIEDLFAQRAPVTYEKGERVLRAHEDTQDVYYVRKGVVRLYLLSLEGNEFTAMLYAKGDIFPLRWLYKDLENIYSFQALTPVELLRLPRKDFMERVLADQEAVKHVLSLTMRDQLAVIHRLRAANFGNAAQRVANSLLTIGQQFAEFRQESAVAEVPLTHQQIADLSGLTRETTSVELKNMERKNVISYRGRTILLTDMPSLKKVAEL